MPDHKIELTDSGLLQAQEARARLHTLIGSNPSSPEWRVYFYVSPYDRTRSTLREIGRSFSNRRVIGIREEGNRILGIFLLVLGGRISRRRFLSCLKYVSLPCLFKNFLLYLYC
ncbi:hypothetical protein ARALYDRAFT_894477 [Arabidopsis lyrata subsp. lyrata]|uniref:Uncharacterized protein n=1 Tax=Arabidopsis lyrata subsp. lyrata TaxID=81972 RepID=D7KV30_ARALL|nr:hypothetical protein ARALYDRAFT_894477 [Arabidopsis lyrata subsp. lyrata]